MKNYRQPVIDAIKKAGYEFVRPVKHGDMYKKGDLIAVVPRHIKTHKIANSEIRRLER